MNMQLLGDAQPHTGGERRGVVVVSVANVVKAVVTSAVNA